MMRRSFLFAVLALIALSSSAQLLWKVSGNGLEKPSYILGTMHFASESFLDEIPGMEQAFEDCDIVVGEIDHDEFTDEKFQMAMTQIMDAPPDSTLDKLLTSEEYALVEQEFNKYLGVMGMKLEQMNTLNPYFIRGLMLAMKWVQDKIDFTRVMDEFQGLEDMIDVLDLSNVNAYGNNRMDGAVQKRAKEMGRPSVALESIEEQLDLLFNVPLTEQAKNLLEACKNPDLVKAELTQSLALIKAYKSQDLTKIHSIITDSEFLEAGRMDALLVVDRNRNWIEKLVKMIPEHACLIYVGAAHLPGDQGLLQLLRNEGYTVEPMQ